QTVISACQIDEAYEIKQKRLKVISRVDDSLRNARDDIMLEDAAREIISNRSIARTLTATNDTIKIVRRDVVEEAEPHARRVIRRNNATALKNSEIGRAH